jgi:hypothetical protein
MQLLCPACGAELQFKSRISVFGVCSYCHSTVVRHDLNLEALGKMAELPADMSPLQIGTRGQYESKNFEIVGRLKIGWEDGNWNEWYVVFDDGRDGWLAEAQGFYMMSFAVSDLSSIPDKSSLYPGLTLRLMSRQGFLVDDIKEATCIGSEGELPFSGVQGRKSTSVDLSGPDNLFACIDYSDEGVRLYAGKYLDFEKFKFSFLREFDGW